MAFKSPAAAAVNIMWILSDLRRVFKASIFCLIPNPTTASIPGSGPSDSLSDSARPPSDEFEHPGLLLRFPDDALDNLEDTFENTDCADFDFCPADRTLPEPDRWLRKQDKAQAE